MNDYLARSLSARKLLLQPFFVFFSKKNWPILFFFSLASIDLLRSFLPSEGLKFSFLFFAAPFFPFRSRTLYETVHVCML